MEPSWRDSPGSSREGRGRASPGTVADQIVAQPAELAWLTPSGRLRLVSAVVMSTTRRRVLLLADAAPRRGGRAVVHVPRLAPGVWLDVAVLAARRLRVGPIQVRLGFIGAAPSWLVAALSGAPADSN